MQNASPPIKWTVPFAQGDGARVEIPATTADPTRFSLTLGSPPLTGQPPETGGVPPQLEDFNGAMNQIARIAWWAQGGGAFPYDATWAGDSNVNGYAQGAQISFSDYSGTWLSLIDNNTANPDTIGTNWAPLAVYGVTALTGQTGGTVTLTPLQAARRILTIAGTLTSNLIVVVPAWTYDWSVTNLTTGSFTVTVKTAAGAGVLIPQNSTPLAVRGDGTNINSLNPTGRLLNVQTFSTPGTSTYTPTPGTNSVIVEVQGGGGGGGGVAATAGGQFAIGGGGMSGAFARVRYASGFSGVTVTVGAAGAGGAAGVNTGGAGGTTSFGALVSCPGGTGGIGTAATSVGTLLFPQTTGSPVTPTIAGGTVLGASNGDASSFGIGSGSFISGAGNRSNYGAGGRGLVGSSGVGSTPLTTAYGAGGGGAGATPSSSAAAGGAGAAGAVIVYEYA